VSGDTLYIGSPDSDRQFRAYNKSAELGIKDGQAWLRLELELRRLRANGALQSCTSNGVAATVQGHMDDFITYSNPVYEAAREGISVPPVDIQRRDSSRRKWLMGQVASGLAKEMIIDDEFANTFWSAVLHQFEALTKH
jgi:hypothetical protein